MNNECPVHDDFDLDCEYCCAIIDRFMEDNQDIDLDDSEE